MNGEISHPIESEMEQQQASIMQQGISATTEESTSDTRALPEADLPESPRPLVAGAFLGGEYEVKKLVARGLTNYDLASGCDPYVNPTDQVGCRTSAGGRKARSPRPGRRN